MPGLPCCGQANMSLKVKYPAEHPSCSAWQSVPEMFFHWSRQIATMDGCANIWIEFDFVVCVLNFYMYSCLLKCHTYSRRPRIVTSIIWEMRIRWDNCETQSHTVQRLSSSIFTCSFVRPSVRMVTSPFISTVWCSRPYKPYIFWKLIIWWW